MILTNPNRTQEVLRYIVDYWRLNKKSPSLRDIADEFQTSTSVVSWYLDKLVKSGDILPKAPGESRSIVPAEVVQAIDDYFSNHA